MEPQANSSPDSHLMQSSAAVQQAYSGAPAAPQVNAAPPPAAAPGVMPAPNDEAAVEQEWVEKAKAIVLRTQDDPFMQNKLLSELKLEYLATRYGRAAGPSSTK